MVLRLGMLIRFASYCVAVLICFTFGMTPASAQDGPGIFGLPIGVASGFNNDYLGDGEDRWQTASYYRAWLYKRPADAPLNLLGGLFELRARGQIITPERLGPVRRADERRYAGTIALAAFLKRNYGFIDHSIGVELGLRGPSSGMGNAHILLHQVLGENEPKGWDSQLPDEFWLGAYGEMGWSIPNPSRRAILRPFMAAQTTDETLLRVGFDFTFGTNATAQRSMRDVVTGHRMPVRDGRGPRGLRTEMGADIAWVGRSDLMSGAGSVAAEEIRYRMRGAFLVPAGIFDATFGLTYLSPEFIGQQGGQTLGSLSLNLRL